ncbi:MAG: septum formation initiator family protein [Spirochaetales bacterium]
MILRRLIISTYVCALVYLTSTLFFGSTGFLAYKELQSHYRILKENLDRIEEQGRNFQQRIAALQSDPEQIRLEARMYHLALREEGFVRIVGRTPKNEAVSPGSIVRLPPPSSFRPEPLLRAFALCIGIVVFLLLKIRSN